MPKYIVTSPDGKRFEVSAPEGASQEEVLSYAQSQFQKQELPPPLPSREDSRKELMKRELMAFASPLRGVKDIVDTGAELLSRLGGADVAAQVKAQNEAGKAEFDAGTKGSMVASTGRFGGQLAATGGLLSGAGKAVATVAPRLGQAIATSGMTTGATPLTMGAKAADLGIRGVGGALAGGATAGLVDPKDAAAGAVLGGALPVGVKAGGEIGRAIGGAFSRADPARDALAKTAMSKYDIPLSVSDISGNPLVKGARSFLDDVPGIGAIGSRQREAVQQGYNKAVGGTFGAAEKKLTPQVIDGAKARMGAEFDRIWNNNSLQMDGQMFQKMQGLRAEVTKLPQGEAARLSSWLDDIESKFTPGPGGVPMIPGDVANRLQSKLGKEAKAANGFLKESLSDLRGSLIGAFNRSVAPADAAALTMTRAQYKAFKTIEPLLQGAEAGVAGRAVGDVPASLVPQAVRQSYQGGISGSPLGDISQIGSQFVADRVARTGGGPRAMFQNSVLGTGLTLGAMNTPAAAAVSIPAAIALEALLASPKAARALSSGGLDQALLPLYRSAPLLAGDR
jgi:hypothetical protein